MPSQIFAPVAVAPSRKGTHYEGSSDLIATLSATLEAKHDLISTPVRSIQERDWDVPAPPPPSPSSRQGSESIPARRLGIGIIFFPPRVICIASERRSFLFQSFREFLASHKGQEVHRVYTKA
ncbi:hypothetical protein F4808DRAFT_455435 [Astrocystis sublimbata]|nr:hypothetical protein F4808DRAFT_455435 [Astrocystis sublimbata]